jgi:hypothetical protein
MCLMLSEKKLGTLIPESAIQHDYKPYSSFPVVF